jgi:hypothetical protein
MQEILPDSQLALNILHWLAFAVLVMLALGAGFFSLALGARGLERVKREGKKLLGHSEVLTLADGLAAVEVTSLHQYMDDPNDVLIMLIAQALRQDPTRTVKRIDGAFTVFGQLQSVWPQIKEALGLREPPGDATK